MQSKEEKIHEFFSNGKIYDSGYETIIVKIINRIYKVGFSFALDYAVAESRISWGEKQVWIRIKKETTPIQYAWNLLHEYGHYLSGEQPANYTELDELAREEEAWDNALKEIQTNYPILLNELEDFNSHREFCLKNYRLKHNDLKSKLK